MMSAAESLLLPIGYAYRCQSCSHHWVLFAKRFALGPPLRGDVEFTCLSCQTFLAVPATVDRYSWSAWLSEHETRITENHTLAELARWISNRLQKKHPFTPVELQLAHIECPTCQEPMSNLPFGQEPMKCPACGKFTGEFDGSGDIASYA
jgi:hypothetical protein